MAAQLQLVLVTPETTLLDEPVDALRFPLFDGQIGILPGRAPLIGRLGHGELRISSGEGVRSYFVDGGFAQVKGETVTLLTGRAMPTSELDASEARALLEDAAGQRPTNDDEFAAKQQQQQRARAMRALADRS
ncbi:MAG: F0F1 ATP synthase subunit epsilon [Planctomycetaceae bacterium]|nr:F0F1 ATP synthase subunit epsilon [Planctomycetaceae bacterium]